MVIKTITKLNKSVDTEVPCYFTCYLSIACYLQLVEWKKVGKLNKMKILVFFFKLWQSYRSQVFVSDVSLSYFDRGYQACPRCETLKLLTWTWARHLLPSGFWDCCCFEESWRFTWIKRETCCSCCDYGSKEGMVQFTLSASSASSF